jgi:Flp pilus assembly pilin Flp
MKAILTRFVRDESGEADFDPLTVVVIGVGFVASLYLLLHTFGGVFDGVSSLLPQ